MSDGPLVELKSVSKAYGGVQALSAVSMTIERGEIHALCGENGAGKSTLIKVLAGSVMPDEAEVRVAGEALTLGRVSASEAAGIAVIHQESVAFAHLDTHDNIFTGREPRWFGGLLLDRRAMRRQTRTLLTRLGETFDPHLPVGWLPLAQRQMVGIARALSQECRLLIMDEPTASLSARETGVLLEFVRQLRRDGVSVLYVSHRLDEVFQLADRVTVLRDGERVATRPTDRIDQAELIRLMVGRELLTVEQDQQRERDEHGTGGERPAEGGGEAGAEVPLLHVRGLTRRGVFEDVTFDVRPGEVVGMAGLVGAGRSEVAQAVFGVDPYQAGTVEVNGRRLRGGSVRAAMRAGVALVPEDRQHLGLVLPMSVRANLSMAVLRTLTRWGLVSRRRERALVERLIDRLAIKTAGIGSPAETLSGGNQQKLVLGKWLAMEPRVLLLDEPTRGVDVGAKAEVYRLIRMLARRGIATVLISSDLPEVLLLSDRVLVMRGGRLTGELTREQATQEKVLELAILPGGGAPAAAEGGPADGRREVDR